MRKAFFFLALGLTSLFTSATAAEAASKSKMRLPASEKLTYMYNMFVTSCDAVVESKKVAVTFYVATSFKFENITQNKAREYWVVNFEFEPQEAATGHFLYNLCQEKHRTRGRIDLQAYPYRELGTRGYWGHKVSSTGAFDKSEKEGVVSIEPLDSMLR